MLISLLVLNLIETARRTEKVLMSLSSAPFAEIVFLAAIII